MFKVKIMSAYDREKLENAINYWLSYPKINGIEELVSVSYSHVREADYSEVAVITYKTS